MLASIWVLIAPKASILLWTAGSILVDELKLVNA